MALTQQEIDELKGQLRSQVQHLPPSQREQAEAQIASLSPEALELMLEQEKTKNAARPKKTIFRSIVDNDVPSIVVEETSAGKAVMDITPISKGHVLIIPVKPVADAKHIPVAVFALAKRVAQRISRKLNSRSTSIQTEDKFGETVIHVIPSYGDKKDLSSERTSAKKEELEAIAHDIRPPVKKPKIQKIREVKKEKVEDALPIKRRIP